MKKRSSIYPYLIPLAALFILLNMPKSYIDTLNYWVVSTITGVKDTVSPPKEEDVKFLPSEEIVELRRDNARLEALVRQELLLLTKMNTLQQWSQNGVIDRHQKHLENTINLSLDGIIAEVIYRSPGTWNSSLWINKGHLDHATCVKNAPVLLNGSLIGLIDFVGEHQSRVRLITDSGLNPAVRTARGAWKDAWLLEAAVTLLSHTPQRHDLLTDTQQQQLTQLLNSVIGKLRQDHTSPLFAKGELHGASAPLWRSTGQLLKGTGFNYDFADEEGPARDLRTGIKEGSIVSQDALPLIKVKDILVTSGYDGVFPPGIPVAEVTKISPLNEGDYYYELEAKPTAGDLSDIQFVMVVPPVGYIP